MLTRRDFLARGLRDSSLIALAPTLPGFLARTAHAAGPEKDGRILVVLQLDGGNDGINTVVPFKDDGYAKHRTAIRLPEKRLITVNRRGRPAPGDGRRGEAAGIGAAGDRAGGGLSESQSLALPQHGDLAIGPARRTGAHGAGLGRSRPRRGPDDPRRRPAALLVGSNDPPPALRGRRSVSAALDRLDDYALSDREARARPAGASADGDDLGQFLRRSLLDAYTTADRLESVAGAQGGHASYPESELARRLGLTARLIKAGMGTRVYYLVQGGYDTHGHQLPQHAALLEELAKSLRAFLDDLAAARLDDRVLVLVFSEFGRRVAENGSKGTDHGTAGPVLLAGPSVRPGLVGTYPSLTDLADGDLKMAVDFRRVYATVLDGWLGLRSKEALGGAFECLPLIRS